MDYGTHIGEYTKMKIQASGRTFKWVADQLHTSRQNFTETWLNKIELKPTQMAQLEAILGRNFFDEFFKNNKQLKRYRAPIDLVGAASLNEQLSDYKTSGSGYTINIAIDPGRFNPDHFAPLAASLKKALQEFQAKTEEE